MPKSRAHEIGALMPLGALCGALIGIFTNAINGLISPTYFVVMMGWNTDSAFQIWARSMAQGALEGCGLGAFLGFILMISVGFTSRLHCPLKFSAPALFDTILVTLLLWFVFGFNAVLLALFAPQFYELFLSLPPSKGDAIRFAWVAGSVNSLGIGGLLAICFACARFNARWKQRMKAAENENCDFLE